MALQPQPYQGANDFAAMRYILTEGCKLSRHSRYIHIGDLNWWLYYILPSKQLDLREIAYVWRDGDAAVGWSLFTPADGIFDLFVHPRLWHSERRAHMLAWTADHAAELAPRDGLAEIRTEFVFADDPAWSDLLAAQGFTPDTEEPGLHTVFDLQHIPDSSLPEGFTVRSLAGTHEAAQRAETHRLAFSGSRMTEERYVHFMTSAPDYRPELDVIVVAPDGRVAAYAQGWIDPDNALGYFEPIGTHPDFRKLGLARAAIYEALRRMQAAGATEAVVCPYEKHDASEVYRKLGFQTRNKIIAYRKAL